MPKNNPIQVFYRIFPAEENSWEDIRIDGSSILVKNLQVFSLKKTSVPFSEFKTDGVFVNKSQNEVFVLSSEDMLETMRSGNNGVIIAFGQTGSGKSFTLTNLEMRQQIKEHFEDLGIIPKIIEQIFNIKDSLPTQTKMAVQMTYLEFSGSTVVDLLRHFPNYVKIWNAKGATKINVKNAEEALKLIYLAEARKNVVRVNKYWSNIGTTIFTLYIALKNFEFSNAQKIESRLHVIDMSGVDTFGKTSESFKNSSNVGQANLRMSNLAQYFLSMISNENLEINQRRDPFLYFVDGDLRDGTSIRFIGHLKFTKENFPVTLSMLRFGQMVKCLKPSVKQIVVQETCENKLRRLQNELDRIRREHLQNSVLMNQDLLRNLNEERVAHMRKLVKEYMKSNTTEFKIVNVEDAVMVLKCFRDLYWEHKEDNVLSQENSKTKAVVKKQKRMRKSTNSNLTVPEPEKRPEEKEAQTTGKVSTKGNSQEVYNTNTRANTSLTDSVGPIKVISTKTKVGPNKSIGSMRSHKKGVISHHSSHSTKHRSSQSLIESTPGKSQNLQDELLENMPSNEEAWKLFSEEKSYKALVEEFRKNKISLKEAYEHYLTQLNKAMEVGEDLESKKKFVGELKLNLNFEIIRNCENADSFKSAFSGVEDQYKSELEKMKEAAQQLQEEVLLAQSLLKLHLNIKKDLKAQLVEQYQTFCKATFNTILPSFQDLDEEESWLTNKDIDFDETLTEEPRDKSRTKLEKPKLNEFYEMMNRERIRYNKAKDARKRWK